MTLPLWSTTLWPARILSVALPVPAASLLEGVRLFDVYRDPVRIGAGKKSMAFALTYRSDDHTLTSEEVEKAHQKIVTKVCKGVNGEVRG